MKKIVLFLSLFFAFNVVAVAQTTEKTSKEETPKTMYTCPMHPEVKSNQPGKCPKCGMDLVVEKKMKMEKNCKKKCCMMHSDETGDQPAKSSKCGMDMKEMKSMKEKMYKDMDSVE